MALPQVHTRPDEPGTRDLLRTTVDALGALDGAVSLHEMPRLASVDARPFAIGDRGYAVIVSARVGARGRPPARAHFLAVWWHALVAGGAEVTGWASRGGGYCDVRVQALLAGVPVQLWEHLPVEVADRWGVPDVPGPDLHPELPEGKREITVDELSMIAAGATPS
ncbi:hypothetical protein [Pseudonocardia acidicola]|uniref:Uncharacterized protein n=1 Tax=Pseudonocardia acidicola TaxID=2724939 RepID=A0ABX1SIA0_9PSEU|nr:hypothetical protein [Pseudonocardia acidicola]NMH99994.1 hypothetical protein [Pseudonocardia acidicola]